MERSSSYPSFTIEECVDFAIKVYLHFGESGYIKQENIGDPIGKKYVSIKGLISSCSQYGLIDKKSKEGYKPNEIITALRNPVDDREALELRRQLFANAPFYRFILGKYEDKIFPQASTAIKPFAIREYGIASNAADHALKVLFLNVEALSLVSKDGTLTLAPQIQPADKPPADQSKNGDDTVKPPIPNIIPQPDQHTFPIVFKGGRRCEFSFPSDGITDSELKHAIEVIRLNLSPFIKPEAATSAASAEFQNP